MFMHSEWRASVNDSAITDQTNYTVTGLTSSTDYTFTVKAIGNNGSLPQLSAVTVTTKRTAPTNLQLQQLHHQQF
jgi:chitodextrinase